MQISQIQGYKIAFKISHNHIPMVSSLLGSCYARIELFFHSSTDSLCLRGIVVAVDSGRQNVHGLCHPKYLQGKEHLQSGETFGY